MSRDDFISLLKHRNLLLAESLEIFSFVDRNQDGVVSEKEYTIF